MHAVPGGTMRQHVGQFMQQGRELLLPRQTPVQQDVASMSGAVNEIGARSPPHRRAQRGGESLQSIQVMFWNPRCVHG